MNIIHKNLNKTNIKNFEIKLKENKNIYTSSYCKELEMQEEIKLLFKNYLIDRGYKEKTPKGYGSTVYDYCSRINYIVYYEHFYTWIDVILHIDKLLIDYSENGIKSNLGKKSNCAVINALRRFYEFLIDNNLKK